MSTMQETNQQDTHDPPRNLGIPLNPIPQTNTGTLEHTTVPFSPFEQITDITPDFSWMVNQWKLKGFLTVSTKDKVGTNLAKNTGAWAQGVVPVLSAYYDDKNTNVDENIPNWSRLPFASSIWWKGTVSHRFTIIKPPRVVGKLLIRWRQDAFMDLHDKNPTNPTKDINDGTMRSILKEWDLAASNTFEFDVSASLPIRARPTKASRDAFSNGSALRQYAFIRQYYPWIYFNMGGFKIEVAQVISPGSIFPDSYTIIMERAFKDTEFMTPTTTNSVKDLVIDRSIYDIKPQ